MSESTATTVKVRLPTLMRPAADGQSTVTVNGATVGEVINQLVTDFPPLAAQLKAEDGGLHRFVNVYVDDDDVRYLQKLDTPVTSSSVISILPAVAGGATRGARL